MTLDELADLGVDGFVSMVGFHEETIQRYAPSHLMVPTVMTLPEAFQAVSAGAHFCKMIGPDLKLVRLSRGDGGFGFCPPMVTGGMSLDRIPETIEAGALFVGTGFELTLKDCHQPISKTHVAEVLREYMDTARDAQRATWPVLAQHSESDMVTWLNALPHHHPFEMGSIEIDVPEVDPGHAMANRF
jgi:2-keto-3-deoxy-6-phosphogluconate aldolase